MVRELSYRATIARPQVLRDKIYTWFLVLSSWPRLVLEVFIRSNFGERYFSLSSAVMVTVILALYPIVKTVGLQFFSSRYGYHHEGWGVGAILRQNLLWYGYVIAFMFMAVRRWKEIQRVPGEFNFARYSLSTGIINSRFWDFEFGGKAVTRRTIETVLEPAFFFFIGLLLWGFGQPLGKLFVLCAFIYSMSYRAMYRIGDAYVLDWIDKLIVNRQMVNAFVDGLDASQTQGFQFYGRRPADPNFRRELAERMIDRDELIEAV